MMQALEVRFKAVLVETIIGKQVRSQIVSGFTAMPLLPPQQ